MSSDPPIDSAASPEATYTRRLRTNALARFISSGSVVIAGFVTATVTARWLGPADKGTLSTMLYIATISSLVATLGLGDAAIVLAGGDKKRLQDLMSLTTPLILTASFVGISLVLAAAWMGNWSEIMVAVAAACVLVPLKAMNFTLIHFQNAMERLVQSSLISVAQVTIEMVLLVILVIAASMEIAGAVIASAAAAGITIILSLKALASDGLHLGFKRSVRDVRPLLTLGISLIVAQLVIALAQRFDLLLVYTLEGQVSAGQYSIALTLGQLAAYTAGALSMASFPRLARLENDDAWNLIPRLARMGLASAIISALFLASTVPILVPLLFGQAFEEATTPALILVLGAVAWSELSILTRAVAALGHPVVQLLSFLVFLVVMAALDFILIPAWGIVGAAIASVIAPSVSLLTFWTWYRKQALSEPLREFIPRRQDVVELLSFIRDVLKRGSGAIRHPRSTWNS